MVEVGSCENRVLFTNDTYGKEAFPRQEIRPLGVVSDYVVEVFPHILTTTRDEPLFANVLVQDIDQLLYENLSTVIVGLQGEQRALALVDLKYLRNGLGNSNTTPGNILSGLVIEAAHEAQEIETITYENTVFDNPRCDSRTFTGGRTGQTENDFYEVHRRIEYNKADVLSIYAYLIPLLERHGTTAAAEASLLLQDTNVLNKADVAHMRSVSYDMQAEDFLVFREYFKGYPEDLHGASGAFSASIPIYDIQLLGKPDGLSVQYMHRFRDYFPRDSRDEMDEVIASSSEKKSLFDYAVKLENPRLVNAVLLEADTFLKFLQTHKAGVARQIEGALNGAVQGTGGFGNVNTFLDARIQRVREKRNMLKNRLQAFRVQIYPTAPEQ